MLNRTEFFTLLGKALPELSEFRQRLIVHLAQVGDRGVSVTEDAAGANQHVHHGLAWYVTLIHTFDENARWLQRLQAVGSMSASALDAGRLLACELAAELRGGVVMHQLETIRIHDFGLAEEHLNLFSNGAIAGLANVASDQALRSQLIELMLQDVTGNFAHGLENDTNIQEMADTVRRFAAAEIEPYGHGWHLENSYIPDEIIERMAGLGVFGISVSEQYGGMAASKATMCAITEELSRAYIGAGSLGTRSEIASELIQIAGTDDQKAHYLPKIATGELLPAAAFTEPEAGSDLGNVRCRAVREGDDYIINGSKIWITHGARADVLTLLARTDAQTQGYRGLSMFLVDKPRGDDADPFPAQGMSGSEIEVIGYRGMKEYEIGFQDFRVPAWALLGSVEGHGFRQLMQTFETARIQTAARASGVARAAMDHAIAYAKERRQFGKSLIMFPRVANKIAKMYIEILGARLLTLAAARAKDAGQRCDLEAGMAKLYAARAAWSTADGAVQIHGGNGFALASPVSRLLCDARILSIFEGAAEIQALIIARRLLEAHRNDVPETA